jgi:hypothetical protein
LHALAAHTVQAQASGGVTSEETEQWFIGAYYRHAWVPSFMLKPVFERAAGISNNGFGLVLSHSSRDGLTAELGLGYVPYHFEGAFNPNNSLVEDTEWAKSNLALVHLTASLLWPFNLHRMLTLELGLGVDLGLVTGSLHRTEAYPKDGAFHACESALNPSTTGPDDDARGKPLAYCEQAYDRNGKPTDTSGANVSGAHYNDKESRVPPLMLVPMLPHLALRFAPAERVAIKLEAAFGLVQFWVGASIHVGFGTKGGQHREPLPAAEPQAQGAPMAIANPATLPTQQSGRIIGKLMEQTTGTPIARASVKNKRQFSAIQTDSAGLFVFENLNPGPLRLEITHPDYETGTCDTTIPEAGGDVNVHCFLRPGHKEGAISGQVKDSEGRPVPDARVEITGPVSVVKLSDASGLFALVDAPAGTYRLRIQAPGYLVQLIELQLEPRDTALPQIILLKSTDANPPRETRP